MIKKISAVSLIAVILFLSSNMTTTRLHNAYTDESKIGWPFVFFTAEPEKQIDAGRFFSSLYLGLDLLICIAASFVLFYLFPTGKKASRPLQHSHRQQV